jgi:hypothetical protein
LAGSFGGDGVDGGDDLFAYGGGLDGFDDFFVVGGDYWLFLG